VRDLRNVEFNRAAGIDRARDLAPFSLPLVTPHPDHGIARTPLVTSSRARATRVDRRVIHGHLDCLPAQAFGGPHDQTITSSSYARWMGVRGDSVRRGAHPWTGVHRAD